MIDLYIPLPPISWESARKGKYGFYDPIEKEKRCIRFYIKEQYKGDPITDYVLVDLEFNFSVPKSFSKKKRDLIIADKLYPTKKDCTNMQKLYEDCLKGIVIEDDRKVVKISSTKNYALRDSIYIYVYTLEELCL